MKPCNRLMQLSTKRITIELILKKVMISLLIINGILMNCHSQALNEREIVINDIDSIRKAFNIPGLTFGVANRKSIIIAGGLGIREINTVDSVTINDYFNFGSLGKGLTSFMIGKLVDEGKITWDTRFFDLFPELKATSRKEYYDLSLKDLLSMRTTLVSLNNLGAKQIIEEFNENYKEDRFSYYKFAEYALTLEPVKYDSGQFYNYTSTGYVLANLMLENASGLTYSQIMEKTNKDLAINFLIGWPQQLGKNQPSGHIIPAEIGLGEYNKLSIFNDNQLTDWLVDWFYYFIPSGNHSVSINDYLKYLQLNLNGINGQNNYLTASTYDFIFNGAKEYAMGWGNGIINCNNYYNHTGSTGNFMARAVIIKEQDIAIAILINSGNNESNEGLHQIFQYLEKKYAENRN